MVKKILKNKYFPWILLGLEFIIIVILDYYVQWRCLDSDIAADMVLANLLNKERAIVSKNWYYSTEVKVFCEPILYQLGLLISPNNWRVARVIGHAIHLALYIGSFIFFSHSTSFKKKGIWIAIVLLMPFGFWYLFHGVFGGTYFGPTIPIFIMLGLTLRYIEKHNNIYLILLFISGVFFGLNGIKLLMYYTVPSFLTLVILYVYKYVCNIKESYKNYLIPCVVGGVSAIIGVAIYLFVICKQYICFPSFYLIWGNIDFSVIFRTISKYLQSLGFVNADYFSIDVKILSGVGVLGVFGIINIIIFLFSMIYLIKNKYLTTGKNKLLFLFIISSYICCICMFALSKTSINGSYWIPMIPYAFVVMELCIESLKEQYENIKYLRFFVIISIILCSIANTNLYLNNPQRSYRGTREAAWFLANEGYKNVISEFWVSNVVSEYSNGKIEPYTVKEFEDYEINNWLQKVDHTKLPNDSETCIIIPDLPEFSETIKYYWEDHEFIDHIGDLYIYKATK